jgi:flagellin-like protein
MKRLFRNRKAVSPVIATVLMIMVTMAGMAILFGFVISYSDSYKAGIGSSVMESLVVEDIWLSPPSSNPTSNNYNTAVDITIYNVGKIDSKITSVYVNGLKLTDRNPDNLGKFELDIPVDVGQHLTIPLNWEYGPWQNEQPYTFRITTLRGSNFDILIKP